MVASVSERNLSISIPSAETFAVLATAVFVAPFPVVSVSD
jgi:hypothetical protein